MIFNNFFYILCSVVLLCGQIMVRDDNYKRREL